MSELRHVDFSLDAGCFASRRQIDSVTKKTVTRHAAAYDPGHHFAAIDTDCDLIYFLVFEKSNAILKMKSSHRK